MDVRKYVKKESDSYSIVLKLKDIEGLLADIKPRIQYMWW